MLLRSIEIVFVIYRSRLSQALSEELPPKVPAIWKVTIQIDWFLTRLFNSNQRIDLFVIPIASIVDVSTLPSDHVPYIVGNVIGQVGSAHGSDIIRLVTSEPL